MLPKGIKFNLPSKIGQKKPDATGAPPKQSPINMSIPKSLVTAPKPSPQASKPAAASSVQNVFGDDSDEEETPSTSNDQYSAIARVNAELFSKKPTKAPKADQQVDPSIYDYDAAYDKIAEEHRLQKEHRLKQKEGGAAQYLATMQEQTALRKREQQITKDRMLVLEREKEDKLYSNSLRIVTGAYKRKLAEDEAVMRALAERDGDADATETARRDEARKKLVTGMGMAKPQGTILLGAVNGVGESKSTNGGSTDEPTGGEVVVEAKPVITLSSLVDDEEADVVSKEHKSDGHVASARERYLARKRQKLDL